MRAFRWGWWASLLLGALASASLYIYLNRLEPRFPVVVVREKVEAFSRLQEGQLKVALVPADTVNAGAATRVNEVVGLLATSPLYPGEQVLRYRLATAGEEGIAAGLSPGERAMLLPAPLEQAGGGVIEAGCLVDVIFVADDKEQPPEARLLATGLPVLDVRDDRGQKWSGRGNPPLGVVVAVSPEQTERLAFALEHGSVYLALCPWQAEPACPPGANWQNLFSSLPAPDPAGDVSSPFSLSPPHASESGQSEGTGTVGGAGE